MTIKPFFATLSAALSILVAACTGGGGTNTGTAPLSNAIIRVDGSSTVYPITEAVAEEFQRTNPNRRVTVGISGTGGGFKRFCAGETDISDASRPITRGEMDTCAKNGINFIELPVAYDGLAVVVNPRNTWVDYFTVPELKKIWEPEAQGKITLWSQVRPGWPDRELHLFGAGTASGTYDYFTEAIAGKLGASRGDYTASEDDNVLVQGVSTDEGGLGYFGYAYYAENKNKLKLVPVDDGRDDNDKGPIAPSQDTVRNGTYQPLSRPLFVYVSAKAVDRPEVRGFIDYYLKEGASLVDQVGFIQLGERGYDLVRARFAKRQTGSLFAQGGSQVGLTIEQLLSKEQ
jgi:phosphate transport system substrate-binding protein